MKSRSSSSSGDQSEFALSAIRVAVAQICQSLGFKGAQSSALEILTDIAARYLKVIGRSAAASANSHGRTEANVLDVLAALEELGSVGGFRGGSDPTTHLWVSGVIEELSWFLKSSEEIPFAKSWQEKVFLKNKDGFLRQDNESSVGYCGHIAPWLPPKPQIIEEERENKWGFGGEAKGIGVRVNEVVRKEEMLAVALPEKRVKVKFGISMGKGRRYIKMTNGSSSNRSRDGGAGGRGVWRVGAMGKRVPCEKWCSKEQDEDRRRLKC